MYKLLVLADDLTGALDTGVQFSRAGISTDVYPFPDYTEKKKLSGPEVLVINTDSRHLSPARAGERVSSLAALTRNIPFAYKKTDSTLRGHIGAELEALIAARDIPFLPFIPAYPDLGRTTEKGFQLLGGIPIDQTPMARDPLNPINQSEVKSIIAKESNLPVASIPQGAVFPQGEKRRGIGVFDCKDNSAMDAIGNLFKKEELLKASAGCAGFARVLMTLLPLSPRENSDIRSLIPNPPLPLLALSGSLHPVSTGQIEKAASSGVPLVKISSAELINFRTDSKEAKELAAKVRFHLQHKKSCIVCTNGDLPRDAAEGYAEKIAGAFAQFAASVLHGSGELTVSIFGGDTLMALMDVLKLDHLVPLTEIEPGVVLANAGGRGKKMTIVTKSGAFGSEDTLLNIISYLGA